MLEEDAGSGVVGTKFISGSSTQRGSPWSFNMLGESGGLGYLNGGDNVPKMPKLRDSTDFPLGSTVLGDTLLAIGGPNCGEDEEGVRSIHFGGVDDVGGGESTLGGARIPIRAGGDGNA